MLQASNVPERRKADSKPLVKQHLSTWTLLEVDENSLTENKTQSRGRIGPSPALALAGHPWHLRGGHPLGGGAGHGECHSGQAVVCCEAYARGPGAQKLHSLHFATKLPLPRICPPPRAHLSGASSGDDKHHSKSVHVLISRMGTDRGQGGSGTCPPGDHPLLPA